MNGETYLECTRFDGKTFRIEHLDNKHILFMGHADVMRRVEVVVNKKARELKLAMWPELGCTNNCSNVMRAYDGCCIVYAVPVDDVKEIDVS